MQEDIKQKQGFLYREVIQTGYSPESFQEFILNYNPQKGMDLQLWSMKQLKEVVTNFKKDVESKKMFGESPIKAQSTQEVQSPIKKSSTPISAKQQDFFEAIQCIQAKSRLVSDDTVIVIDSFQKKEGGMFEKSYIVYQVKIDSLKSSVMRRYSDFQLLREVLESLYPGLPIPPIAKKGKMKRKQQKHLFKRMFILEKFLNVLLMIQQIRYSQIFYKFLTSKDTKDLQNEKSRLKKLKVIPLNKLQTLSGKVQLKIEANVNNFNAKSQKYFSSAQPEVKKLYKGFKGIATMFENSAQILNSMNNVCKNLSKQTLQYQTDCSLPIRKNNIFNLLSDLSSQFSQILIDYARLFRKQVHSMLKYDSLIMMNFVEGFEKLSQIQASYFDHKQALLKKKEKLYEEGNISKWGCVQKVSVKPSKQQAFPIMLAKQTNQIYKERQVYALYNYQIYKQVQRYMNQNQKILFKYLNESLQKQSDINSRAMMLSADLLLKVKDTVINVN